MGQFQLKHGSKGEEKDGYILRSVGDVVCITQMYCG